MTVRMLASRNVPPPRLLDKCVAVGVFPAAMVLARTRLVYAERVLSLARRRVSRVPSMDRALRFVAAVEWVGSLYPGRVACLEVAIGSALVGALRGSMPRFCIGAKFNPLYHHAWIEALAADGSMRPVAEAEAHDWPYRAALLI